MPAIRLHERSPVAAKWGGQCPESDCPRCFEVEADPWQSKISVLSALRPEVAAVRRALPASRHFHGRYAVYEPHERGGE